MMSDSVPESTRQPLERLYGDPDSRLTSLFDLAADDGRGDAQLTVFEPLANEHRIRVLDALRRRAVCL